MPAGLPGPDDGGRAVGRTIVGNPQIDRGMRLREERTELFFEESRAVLCAHQYGHPLILFAHDFGVICKCLRTALGLFASSTHNRPENGLA
jgi:hypothetical protein